MVGRNESISFTATEKHHHKTDCYNRSFVFSAGEVFDGLDVVPGANDSRALLQALAAGNILEVFNSLRGPWAFVYWHAASLTLWFGRDVIGTLSATCPMH